MTVYARTEIVENVNVRVLGHRATLQTESSNLMCLPHALIPYRVGGLTAYSFDQDMLLEPVLGDSHSYYR